MINKCITFISRMPVVITVACVVLLLFVVRMSYISCALDTTDQILFDFSKDIGLLREALNNGAAVDTRRQDDGVTPLMAAVQAGDAERVRLFIDYGADINAVTKKLDGHSVLRIASGNFDNAPNMGIIELLLVNGADVRAVDNLGNTVLHAALRVTNYEDRMPLFSLLIKHGADINAQNKNGDTMLHVAIENNNLTWVEIVRDQFGALINTGLRNKSGFTPIEHAQYFNFTDIVYALQKPFAVFGLKGDVDAYDANGLTPLMIAVIGKNRDLVNTLVKDRLARTDLRSNDTFNYPLIHLALFQQDLNMITLLLSLGANLEQTDGAGRTALLGIPWVQMLQKRKQALDMMMQAGANINARDNQGNGLLYYLILHNDLPLFKYVLQTYGNKVQLDLKNNNSDSPMDLARRLRRSEFVKSLGGSL